MGASNSAEKREEVKAKISETVNIKVLRRCIKTLEELNGELVFIGYPVAARHDQSEMCAFVVSEVRENIRLQEALVDKIRSIMRGEI